MRPGEFTRVGESAGKAFFSHDIERGAVREEKTTRNVSEREASNSQVSLGNIPGCLYDEGVITLIHCGLYRNIILFFGYWR